MSEVSRNRFFDSVSRWFHRHIRDDNDDALQDTLIKVWDAFQKETFDRSKSMTPWLNTIVHRTLIDAWRKHKRELAVGGSTNQQYLASLPDTTEVSNCLYRELIETLIVRDPGRLSPRDWEIYHFIASGKPAPAIAKSLDMTLAAFYKAKSRIIATLREGVADLYNRDHKSHV